MPQNSEPLELLKASSPLRDFFQNLHVVLSPGPKPGHAGATSAQIERLTEATRGRIPGRGLLYSFLLHQIAIIALLLVPTKFRSERRFYEVERWLPLDTKLTYNLPTLGGGRKGGGRPGGKSGGGSPKRGGSSPAPAPKTGGLVYPALQPVVSNPPNPTNKIQTILQPELVKPPELKAPLPLPNIVKLARGPRVPAPPPLVPKVNTAALPPVRPPEAPKLRAQLRPPTPAYALPLTSVPPPAEPPKLALPPPTPEPPKAVDYTPIVPKMAQSTEEPPLMASAAPNLALPSGAGGNDDRSLLVLSPTPGPPEAAGDVPPGEARGQFAMGPESNLQGSSKLPPGDPDGVAGGTGAGLGGVGAGSGGTGTGSGGTGSGSGEGGGGGGTGKGTGPGVGDGVGPGTGTGSGTGTGTGSGSGINGTGGGGVGNGTGTGTGSGPGRGEGTGTGTGTGSGPGSGNNPFPGISIAGGTGTTGVVGGPRSQHSKTPDRRPTYGMTVVATAASGGGLRDFGIFRNESVFTVYVEMTHSVTPAPSWTFQYALLRRPGANPNSPTISGGSVQMQEHILAPFPINKEKPEFPEEVVARNLGRIIVVYAEITDEGKAQNMRIIQSPNPLLNQPVLEALNRWTFRPAEMNNQPVAVKALLGIPLSLPR